MYLSPGALDPDVVVVQSQQVPALSTSLFGHFKLDHTKIELIGDRRTYFNEMCNPDDAVDEPIDLVDYQLNAQRHYIVLPISKLHKAKHTFKSGSGDIMQIESVLEHTPMRWNFWHFSLQWDTNEGRLPRGRMTNRQSAICKFLKREVIAKYGMSYPDYVDVTDWLKVGKMELEPEHYTFN